MSELDELNSEELNIEDLKEEATSLGVTFSKVIGAVKLKEKIDNYYESQETSGDEVRKAVEKNEKAEAEKQEKAKTAIPERTTGKNVDPKVTKRKAREAAARKMRVVTIIDNDQRVNSQVNTCVVNCSNQFFDLGTKILPLNEKLEICQGHLNVLKSILIPLHVKDNKTGLSVVRMRPRYSISYEDTQ
jgi:hypothetical protein